MKKLGIFALIILFITLTSCNTGRILPHASDASLKERWMSLVDKNPDIWLANVDPWFLTGESQPIKGAIAKTMNPTEIASFTSISIAGDFKVEIVGGQHANSVYIYGQQESVDQVVVEVFKNSLNIHQTSNENMQNVVVRIGVHKLRSLTNSGNSLILGRTIISKNLIVNASGTGSIYLGGNMNLTQVNQSGSGTITLFGVHTPKLNVMVKGNGNVNLSGTIGIETIVHDGDGYVNIIGADSDGVCISAYGNGVTSVFGYMNLREVFAMDHSRVFVYWVYSKNVNVVAQDSAVVGLAGTAANMDIDLKNDACFQGEYMRSCVMYVKTKNSARADVAADLKIFVSTSGTSNVYYFGSPQILTSFSSVNSAIIPLGNYLIPAMTPPAGVFQPPSFCADLCQS